MADNILFVRVAPADKKEITRAADAASMTVSDLVRKSALAAAEALLLEGSD